MWPPVSTHVVAGSEEVEMGSDKRGGEESESGIEAWDSSPESCGINVKLRIIIWVKVINSNPSLACSGIKNLLKLLLTEQSEGTKSARIVAMKVLFML